MTARKGHAPDGDETPWSVLVAVDHIPETGLTREITAAETVCAAMARISNQRHFLDVSGAFELKPAGRGRIRVTGRVHARVGQICVATLDPIENEVDETLDVTFVPADQIAAAAAAFATDPADGTDPGDPPDVIENGQIDLGRLATDFIFLGIDPYPRAPGAVFQPPAENADPDDHPFAALKALKPDAAGDRSPKKS